jgi:hypothetical protein
MKFFENCSIIDGEYVGLCTIAKFPKSKHFLKTNVLQNEQYRPDMVSYRLFNNVNYAWVIDEMNNFYHGFKDYESGKEIFYLRKEDLKALGYIK